MSVITSGFRNFYEALYSELRTPDRICMINHTHGYLTLTSVKETRKSEGQIPRAIVVSMTLPAGDNRQVEVLFKVLPADAEMVVNYIKDTFANKGKGLSVPEDINAFNKLQTRLTWKANDLATLLQEKKPRKQSERHIARQQLDLHVTWADQAEQDAPLAIERMISSEAQMDSQ